ncbi:MAG: L,D-transpeptidase, partial [Gemmatimonadota bacterium]
WACAPGEASTEEPRAAPGPAGAPAPAPPLPVAAEPPAPPPQPLRIEVSLAARRLWLLRGEDTLLAAPAGIGKGTTLRHEGREWRFVTPRGERAVLGKAEDPVWTPPDWHYVEVARENGFDLKTLERGVPVELPNGTRLEVRGEEVGTVFADGAFEPFPPGEEIVLDGVLYVPPLGTRQRRVRGELGTHKLDLGDGYLIHGSRDGEGVGTRASHGCIRLRNADVERLFRAVPVGTPVLIR